MVEVRNSSVTCFMQLGSRKQMKGDFAEGEHLPGCLSWVAAEYASNCHESGVLSWINFFSHVWMHFDAFLHGCFYFKKKEEKL